MVAAVERRPARFEESGRAEVIPDVACAPHHGSEIRALPQFVFDHALRSADKRHQQHDIKQRVMVGDNNTGRTVVQSFTAFDLNIYQPQSPEQPAIEPKQKVYKILVALAP